MSRKTGSPVKFGEPPAAREPAPYDWDRIAGDLRSRPGEWGEVFKQDKTSYVTAIRLNGIKALRWDKGFEVRTANNRREPAPRICDLWMRYNPEHDKEQG